MCESKAEGGRRCAAHTRIEYESAKALLTLPAEQRPADALVTLFQAAVDHASTPAGLLEVTQDIQLVQGPVGLMLGDAVRRGRAAQTDRAEVKSETRAAVNNRTGNSRPNIPDVPRVTPGGVNLSLHVIEQAANRGISYEAMVAAIDNPTTTFQSPNYRHQRKHVRDGVCVAVDYELNRACTVFSLREFSDITDKRPADPNARPAAQRHNGRLPDVRARRNNR